MAPSHTVKREGHEELLGIAERITTAAPSQISEQHETDLIRRAQNGDEGATLALVEQYSPAARNAVSQYREVIDEEDALQVVCLAMLDLIRTHDAEVSPRLAGRVAVSLRQALAQDAAHSTGGWAIPGRTLRRFYAVLRAADGDVEVGATQAPAHGMSTDVFMSVAIAIGRADSLDRDDHLPDLARALDGGPECAYTEVDDAHLVDFLMSTLDEDEVEVIQIGYGFTPAEIGEDTLTPEGAAPLADGIVAQATGRSRQSVQRTRTRALKSMRGTLALDA